MDDPIAYRIPLHGRHGQGKYTLVDAEDFEKLSKFKWYLHSAGRDGYAVRFEYEGNKSKSFRMHREVIRCPVGAMVDHINGDRLDNRRSNLRLSTNQQNQRNQRNIRGAVPFKGVAFDRGKYVASIRVDSVKRYLGRFDTPEGAARAYDSAARQYFGEFAYTNF